MIYLYILNNWVVATQICFIVTPNLGEDEPILTNTFQMGWFNHQPNNRFWAPFFFEKWLQVELGPQGIDCVSIWPGVVYTEFVQSLWPSGWKVMVEVEMTRWIPGTPKSNHVLFHGWKWWSTNICFFMFHELGIIIQLKEPIKSGRFQK